MKKWILLIAAGSVLSGCAVGPQANPHDPLEPLNRRVYAFNEVLGVKLIKPVATTYQNTAPHWVQRGVSNFFDNLQDAWSAANNALQLRGTDAAESLVRFGINTLVGLGGVIDVASELNVERHTRDFGHTLGVWGLPSGPYLVLPLLGPSSVRDAVGRAADRQGNIAARVKDASDRNALSAVDVLDTRSRMLSTTKMLEDAALDPYSFVRDAYLQHRESEISNAQVGAPECTPPTVCPQGEMEP